MVADVSECVLPDTSKNVIFLLVALLYTLYNVKPNLCNPNRAISKSTLETVKWTLSSISFTQKAHKHKFQ